MKAIPMCFALVILLSGGGKALARHVTHPVTPDNIESHPFAFTVQIKDAGDLKKIEVTVKQKDGHPAPVGSATGAAVIDASGKKKASFPAITRSQADGVQSYTFQVSASEIDRAHFTFTETPQDALTPFPSPGDYWVFDLSNFAQSPEK